MELCERVVLHAAAVLGSEPDLSLLSQVSEQPPAIVDRALDRLAGEGVLVPDAATGRWRFADESARLAAYASAGAGWRRRAHSRALTALRDRGAPAVEVADHVVAAGEPGGGGVGAVAGAAARRRWRDPAVAARWLRFALDRAPSTALRLRLAEALAAAGDLDAARAALAELPASGGRLRVRALVAASRVGLAMGCYPETIALAQRDLDQGNPRLLAHIAVVQAMAGDAAAARALAEKADRGPGIVGAAALALVRCLDGAYAEAVATGAGEVVDGLTDAELVPDLEYVAWLGLADVLLGRPAQALRRVDRAARVARDRRQVLPLGWLLLAGGLAALAHGELAGARDRLREAARLTGSWGDGHLARVAVALGSLAGAGPGPGLVAGAATVPTQPAWAAAGCGYARARVRLMDADPVGALAVLEPAGAVLEPAGGVLTGELFVRCALQAGDVPAARRRLDRLSAAGAVSRAHAELAAARVALAADGDAAEAAHQALAARNAFAKHGMRIAAGEAGIVAGRAQAAAGEHRAALLTLRTADEVLTGCGATRLGDEAAREQRKLGRFVTRRVLPATRRRNQAQPLSSREAEIARLVTAGMTNRQIAAALFISDKTVERHLSSVFLKLGVSNRAAVALRLVAA